MKRYIILTAVLSMFVSHAQQNWTVPKQAEQMTNTIEANAVSIAKGQKIFKSLCAGCHGDTGKGDVVAMQSLTPKPTDLSSGVFQNQTDGTIYWKISEGRGVMASYKTMLSEEQRWQVVNYLRTLKKPSASKSNNLNASKTTVDIKQNTNNHANTQVISKIDAFPFTNLINAKTTHIMQAKGFGLTIQHRFGLTKFDESFVTNLMGLDLSANMRFAFEIPVSKKIMVEIGRTRYGKFYDVGSKYLAIQQTADNSTPFSLAIYENIALTTEKAPKFSSNATFENGTPFEYKFYHRLYYDTQLIISRKFSNNFSAQLTGQFVWRNLTPFSIKPKEKSYVIAIPISLRYKLGLSSAIDFEIMPNTHHKTMPVSLGYEVTSSGNHVFQITITNSNRFLSQNIFTLPTAKYNKDGFILGFNLTRYF